MNARSSRSKKLLLVAPLFAATLGLAMGTRRASATNPDMTALNERCATRVSVALLGTSASAAMLGSPNPQSAVDAMLADPAFIDRFARFTNSSINDEPGMTAEQDSAYFLSKYMLQNNKPWKELFVGAYNVDLDAAKNVVVTVDPNGVGYFRSPPWLKRYAGNELAGYKLSTAYRIQNNIIGLALVASANAVGVDISASGRQAAPCNQCHYQPYFALDKVARVLTHRVGTGNNMTFTAPPAADVPQQILGGISIHDDKELVTALVESDAFKFRTCRLAFKFLYGRVENKCEGPVFDACMAAFSAQGTMQSALAVVAKDPSFCQ